MKVGLVLEGGAMLGIYTVGVLDTLMAHKLKVDGIIGVSAGALFGIDFASNQRGRAIRYSKKYANDKRYKGFTSFVKTGNIVNKEFAFYKMPKQLDVFDEEAFEKSNIDFYVTITNIKTGKAEYVQITNVLEQIEYFRATSAIPLVSQIVKIDDQEYLDGAISDSIPVLKMKELGYDKIIVILTKPLGYRKRKSHNSLINLKYKEYPKFVQAFHNRYQNYNRSIDKINELEKNHEIFVIRPSRKPKAKRMENNKEKIQDTYELGVKDCKNALKALDHYLSEKAVCN